MENKLQLLVIDLGDCCVVKVEEGQGNPLHMLTGRPIYGDTKGTTVITPMPFTKLREAIEQKPVPRIEKNLPCDKPYVGIYQLISDKEEGGKMHTLYQHEFDALSQLAGKPLPVWEGGKWTRLPKTSEYISDPLDDTGVKIWRYTR